MKKSLYYLISLLLATMLCAQDEDPLGYGITPKTTPTLPDTGYRVHDGNRPVPEKVMPGDVGKKVTYSAPAPSDAVILFNGKNLDKWQDSDHGRRRRVDWPVNVNQGIFAVNPNSKIGQIETVDTFGPVQLHIEWRVPENRHADNQSGTNSGVFFMDGRYEIQILSSYKNKTYADGMAASIYGQYPPLVNASKPQGEWEAYDIIFTPPVFSDSGDVQSPAYVTVIQNGIVVHNHKAFLGRTNWRSFPTYEKHDGKGRIQLQNHGDPIEFRNIWVRNIGDYDTGKKPSEIK